MDSSFVPARLALGQAYVQKKMFHEAINELERAVSLSSGSPIYIASLAHAYGVTGRRADSLRLIGDLKELASRRYVASFDMAARVTTIAPSPRWKKPWRNARRGYSF